MKFLAPLAIAGAVAAAPVKSSAAAPTATNGTTAWASGNTANDVVNGVCAPITVIFARGTTEKGNIGKDVGPYLFQSLITQHGTNIALQGVDYNATWLANTQLGDEGKAQMTSMVKQAQTQCSGTKIALGGYSQGAMILQKSMAELASGVVQAAVAFGDPYNGVVPGSISKALFKEFCGEGDNLCHHAAFSKNVTTHRDYGMNNGTEAAKFLLDNINSGGGSNVVGEIIDAL